MKKFQTLQKKYPKFIYESYSYRISKNNLEILFGFEIEPKIYFAPKITIENINKTQVAKIKKSSLDNLVFHLGLMEIPSYWKATCSPVVEILAGDLDRWQIKWWKDLIMRGMGQFFYENKIDFKKPNFLKIISKKNNGTKTVLVPVKNRVLVPIGGGKDSVVTLEILKKARRNINCFVLNPNKSTQKVLKVSGYRRPIIVSRKIDKKLLELNQKGFLNGHTPFSASLAFLSVVLASLFDYRYIAFSNERSSNEGNVKYLGRTINHQWSKSFDFEQKFRRYSQKYLVKNAEYLSFLRPLYELQIAKSFLGYPKYFSSFLSCNEAYKRKARISGSDRYKTASGKKRPTGKWCRNCSKCLFIFAALYPFTEEKKLVKIFGENLFNKKNLLPIMLELIGERKFKPFECIGTKKESLVAFYLSWKKYRDRVSVKNTEIGSLSKIPFLLNYFKEKILPKYSNLEKESKKIMNSWNNQNNLPKEFEKILVNCGAITASGASGS